MKQSSRVRYAVANAPFMEMVVVHSNGRESVGRVGSVGSVGSVGKNYKYLHHYYAGLPMEIITEK
ncbi:hypothetical protein [Hydrocoleum sp. CS-953]|uniref:hypothetical protein n=1 Tax=Hydrocoleum sp. CS-953 TaxID=1671698 RepID=UPI001179C7F3|nr:hypothetical protein [Hydrocoleum sp. CS-953]